MKPPTRRIVLPNVQRILLFSLSSLTKDSSEFSEAPFLSEVFLRVPNVQRILLLLFEQPQESPWVLAAFLGVDSFPVLFTHPSFQKPDPFPEVFWMVS